MQIVVAGFGVEGCSSYEYFRRKYPEAEIVIADEREQLDNAPEGARLLLGKGAFLRLDEFDVVVRSPSIAPSRIETNGKIWSATNEFFAECPAPIIGVTGTKGKGTTCSLITSILRAAGKTVHLVGNIGVPALEVLPKITPGDIVVYELSSFQLWDLEKSPHIAVVLMIEPDHLDIHKDFQEYAAAKKRIAAHQTADDVVIFYDKNEMSVRIAEASCAKRITYPFSLNQTYADALKLPGQHNRDNACAAIAVARAAFPGVSDDEIIEGLGNFTGLPHRLKFVAEIDSVKYYDDSIATTPGSAIAALRSFSAPKVLIVGGYDKGAEYAELAAEIAKQHMRAVILIGSNAKKIATELEKIAVKTEVILLGIASMHEIVKTAASAAQPGDVVVFSPAAASFDMFKSYVERGEQFVDVITHLEVCSSAT